MAGGYGSSTLNLWRRVKGTLKNGSEFPVTPGRDFSGHIVEVGCGVDRQKFKVGDAVNISCSNQIAHVLHFV